MTKSLRFQLIVFDLDGTLADTLPLIYEAFDYALRPALGRRLEDQEIRQLFGPPDNAIIRSLVDPAEADAAIERYMEAYDRKHDDLVRLFPGMKNVLSAARDASIQLAVVTGKSRQTAIVTLERLGIGDVFSQIWAGDDVAQQKPHPEALLNVLESCDLTNPDEAVMVGDSAADVRAGKAAGMQTIGVLWGSPDHAELRKSSPDMLVSSVAELQQSLGLADE